MTSEPLPSLPVADRTRRWPAGLSIGVIVPTIIGAVILIAALSKLADPSPIRVSSAYFLQRAHINSQWLADLAAAILVGSELAVGLMLIASRAPIGRWLGVGLLGALTIALVLMLPDDEAPACGCLGVVKPADSWPYAEALGIARNVAMIYLLIWSASRRFLQPGIGATRPAPRSPRGGFTITELLVSIAIIAILLGLFLPSLRGARESARTSADLARLRDFGVAVTVYANTHDDRIPYAMIPGDPTSRPQIPGPNTNWQGHLRDHALYSPSLLGEDQVLPQAYRLRPE
ncbi:MAG: type II secretion system protein [Phycisphaerales bacterium]|nr:MAG: type II secretion system protein [Phycisphaerales bacterium]